MRPSSLHTSWAKLHSAGRDKLSLFEIFIPLWWGKECRGYTLFPHLIAMGKKSVEYTFKFLPYWIGKKSIVHSFSPSVRWRKRVWGTLFHRLSNSTNTVESYNQLCKGPTPDVLSVAMMTIYKLDMAATLRHLAVTSACLLPMKGRHLRREAVEPVHKVKFMLSEDWEILVMQKAHQTREKILVGVIQFLCA